MALQKVLVLGTDQNKVEGPLPDEFDKGNASFASSNIKIVFKLAVFSLLVNFAW